MTLPTQRLPRGIYWSLDFDDKGAPIWSIDAGSERFVVHCPGSVSYQIRKALVDFAEVLCPPERTVTVNEPGTEYKCSFCGKGMREVERMFAGPTVFICVGCCRTILGIDERAEPTPALFNVSFEEWFSVKELLYQQTSLSSPLEAVRFLIDRLVMYHRDKGATARSNTEPRYP